MMDIYEQTTGRKVQDPGEELLRAAQWALDEHRHAGTGVIYFVPSLPDLDTELGEVPYPVYYVRNPDAKPVISEEG